MDELYDIAIHELRRLLYDDIKNIESLDINKKSTIQRNMFNKLPIKKVEEFSIPQSFNRSLEEFIKILEILKALDVEFKEVINNYRDILKYENHYNEVEERLLNIVSTFESEINNPSNLLENAIKDLFSTTYQVKSLSNMYFYFYNKVFAYVSEYYEILLDSLAEYYIREICINIPNEKSCKDFIYEERQNEKIITDYLSIGDKFTFLSYAFKDKLVSFLLFLEARESNIVLFVDWMYNYDYSEVPKNHAVNLKRSLAYFLNASNKLLYLRSINSELNTSVTLYGKFGKRQKMVRQWCSWEIGNFYKYYTNFNSNLIKFQYILHDEVREKLQSNRAQNEDNLLLDNFKKIDRIYKMY